MSERDQNLDVLALVLLDLRAHCESELRTVAATQRLLDIGRSDRARETSALTECLTHLGELALANEAVRFQIREAIALAERALRSE